MNLRIFPTVLCGLLLSSLACGAWSDERAAVSQSLDAFHRAAAEADVESYFGLLTDEVVFLGTDGSERWQGQEFRDFVRPRFEQGGGWQYHMVERHVALTADGHTAWFDETLNNAQLGPCRGSGILVKEGDRWKVAQYNLSVPIPNAMVLDVVADIAAADGKPASSTITEGAESAASTSSLASDQAPAVESTEEKKRCGKRFKTNRAANC